jgi:predicted nucleic acid-binding protein
LTSYVLDASVAAIWFLPPADEPLFEQALEIQRAFVRGTVDFVAPDLLWPEVGNVLWKASRRGRITAAAAQDGAEAFSRFQIPSVASAQLLKQAVLLACSTGRSVYDCLYVALAVTTGRPLVTADERLANSLAAHLPIRWLGTI